MFYAIFVFPIAVILSLLISLPIWFLSKHRNGFLYPIRALAFMGFVGTSLIILYATIFWMLPISLTSYHLLNLKPFIWIRETYAMGYDRMLKQLFLNTCMFVPFGILLPVVFPKMRKFCKTLLCAFLFSFLIEFVQYFIGRSADIDDVIMNTAGGLIGYGLFALCRLLFGKMRWWKKALGE